jgi:glycosyltransferase involved in cell wall biosynthesis
MGKKAAVFGLLDIPFCFFGKIARFDVVSVHATWDFHVSVGPIVVILSKLFGKKVIYHFFGGSFDKRYAAYPGFLKFWLKNTIFNSDYKLLETKRMIQYFKSQNIKNLIWYPNTRPQKLNKVNRSDFKQRFVFVSRVTPNKGINEIMKAARSLSPSITIDIYGPLDSMYTMDSFKFVNYKGIVSSDKILDVINKYDVLLLPTYHPGEGYPGIFIEAMSLAKPIITTNWNALDELVQDGYNGILVSPKSVSELKKAIESFSRDNYQNYSNNALKKFDDFNIESAIKKLIKLYRKC